MNILASVSDPHALGPTTPLVLCAMVPGCKVNGKLPLPLMSHTRVTPFFKTVYLLSPSVTRDDK